MDNELPFKEDTIIRTTPSFIVSIVTAGVLMAVAFTSLKSDSSYAFSRLDKQSTRITTVEINQSSFQKEIRDALYEIKSDQKVMVEQMKSFNKNK